MILDYLSQNLVPAMLINGDIQTSFIYNVLTFLSPIYEVLTDNSNGFNYIAMWVGVIMLIMSYFRGHADGFKSFSTLKRNPFIMSVMVIVVLSFVLFPTKLIFVSIDQDDEAKVNLFTELTVDGNNMGQSVVSVDNVPGFLTIPIILFNRYYYGVSYYQYEILKSGARKPIPHSYDRFIDGGDRRIGASPESQGFHLGSFNDFDTNTNYRHFKIKSEIDYIRSGLDQVYFDDTNSTIDGRPNVSSMDKSITAALMSEISYYQAIDKLILTGGVSNSKNKIMINVRERLKGSPLYKNFFAGEYAIDHFLVSGFWSKLGANTSAFMKGGSSEYVGVPIAAYDASQIDKKLLNSCRATAPTMKVAESKALSFHFGELMLKDKAAGTEEIHRICSEALFFKSERAKTCDLINANTTTADMVDNRDLIDLLYKSIQGADTVDKKKGVFYSSNLQTPSEAHIIKDELISICNNHYEGDATQNFTGLWNDKILTHFEEYIANIKAATDESTTKFAMLATEVDAKVERFGLEETNYPKYGPLDGLVVGQSKNAFDSQADPAVLNLSKSLRSTIFVRAAGVNDGLSYTGYAVKNKDQNKSLITSLIPGGTNNLPSTTGLGTTQAEIVAQYLRVLAFVGILNKSSLDENQLYLDSKYPKCTDNFSLEYSALQRRLDNSKTTPDRYLDDVYDALIDMVIGADKNLSTNFSRTLPSEDLIRSLVYQAYVESKIKDIYESPALAAQIIDRIKAIIKASTINASTTASQLDQEISVCDLPHIIDGDDDITEKVFFKNTIGTDNHTFAYIQTNLDKLITNSASIDDADVIGNYRANHILNFLKNRYNSIFPSKDKPRTIKGAIDLSDVNSLPYLSYYYPWSTKKSSCLRDDCNTPGIAVPDYHVFVRDNNLARVVPLLMTGNILSSQQIHFTPADPESLENFRKYFVAGMSEEQQKIYRDGHTTDDSLLASFESFASSAIDLAENVVDAASIVIMPFTDDGVSAAAVMEKLKIFAYGTTYFADMVLLPKISRFLNNSTISLVGALSAGDFNFTEDGYRPPSISEKNYSKQESQAYNSRYSAYMATIISPAKYGVTKQKYWVEMHFLSPAPGMILYNPIMPSLFQTKPSDLLSDVSEDYNEYIDAVVDNQESTIPAISDTTQGYHSNLEQLSDAYTISISPYHMAMTDIYKEYLSNPTKAESEKMSMYWNIGLSIVPVAKFKYLWKGGVKVFSKLTKQAVKTGVPAGKSAATTAGKMAAIKKGAPAAMVAGEGGGVSAGAGLVSKVWRGSKFAAVSKWLGDSFVWVLKKLGYWILIMIALPLVIQLVIMWIMILKLVQVSRYLLMKKIIPIIFFFGSIIKTLFSLVYKLSTESGGRISSLFGKVVEDPLEKAVIPFVRLSLEIAAFYYLFAGIIYYFLYNHLPAYANFVYASGYSAVFEAGVSLIIFIALWLTKALYDLIDLMYPIEFMKEIDSSVEAVKY